MSYARFGDNSDVYVFPNVYGYVECCGCRLGGEWDFHSPAEIVAHLTEHVNAGHRVDPDLLDEGMYPPGDFIPMCRIHLCREQDGHDGDHTPITCDVDRNSQIRARQIGADDA